MILQQQQIETAAHQGRTRIQLKSIDGDRDTSFEINAGRQIVGPAAAVVDHCLPLHPGKPLAEIESNGGDMIWLCSLSPTDAVRVSSGADRAFSAIPCNQRFYQVLAGNLIDISDCRYLVEIVQNHNDREPEMSQVVLQSDDEESPELLHPDIVPGSPQIDHFLLPESQNDYDLSPSFVAIAPPAPVPMTPLSPASLRKAHTAHDEPVPMSDLESPSQPLPVNDESDHQSSKSPPLCLSASPLGTAISNRADSLCSSIDDAQSKSNASSMRPVVSNTPELPRSSRSRVFVSTPASELSTVRKHCPTPFSKTAPAAAVAIADSLNALSSDNNGPIGTCNPIDEKTQQLPSEELEPALSLFDSVPEQSSSKRKLFRPQPGKVESLVEEVSPEQVPDPKRILVQASSTGVLQAQFPTAKAKLDMCSMMNPIRSPLANKKRGPGRVPVVKCDQAQEKDVPLVPKLRRR